MKPQVRIASPEVAVRIYLEYPFELENSELKILFNTKCTSTLTKKKNEVWPVMIERGTKQRSKTAVNTKVAYEVWQIDVEEMKKNIKELRKLNL